MPASPAEPPPPPAPANPPALRALLGLATGVVIVTALYIAREILIPITLAVLLSFVLAPLADLLRRLWLGRVVSVLVAVLLALGAILLIGGLIGTQVAQLAGEAPRYAATIERKVETVRDEALGRISVITRSLGMPGGLTHEETAPTGPEAAPAPAAPAAPGAAPGEAGGTIRSPLELAQRILSPVLGPLETTGIVFIVAIFVLLQREDLRDRMIRLAGATDLHRTTTALDDAARRLSRYFLAQLGLNLVFGIVIGVGLFLIGVPSPLLWGVLATLLRFVPYIGAILAGALPLALAAAVDPGWTMVIWTAALFLVTEPIMGQVVEPLVYGHSTGLSPVSVVISAIFWSWLWGPIGLILSTPLTLCLVVLGRHVQQVEFLDVLLGDRPALTPVESFYQRMLAGDPDEALDQAELLLKERSLSSYYDEVALKGLQLAASDASRGVVPPEQIERVRDAIRGLVADLADHADADPAPHGEKGALPSLAEQGVPKTPAPKAQAPDPAALPPAWRRDSAILCIAGRGPLDEAASAMLAQLLQKHGLGAHVVPHEAVSRGRIDSFDTAGAAMVCISYLEISGSPAHLRYLLRRLRQRLPGAPILVGLWPAEEAVLTDQKVQHFLGADYYTTSLREAVTACLDAAHKASAPAAEPAPRLPEPAPAGPAPIA
ncbi:AI-2E family transporter [Belnapia sp. T6]|uniref:AI-2E family transporter n=1 Tax=Belnapia mucosa TaxID=2804532 RepID=A0ABS1V7X8_9PROT|nr:AI-2E family transporter [Belnapia mucosa]MBL6457722.1 AI-2E family transporter [Belnapia mucosa]